MNAVNISGLSVEEGVEKIKAQLEIDPAAVTVSCDSMAVMKDVARIIGTKGYCCEIWPGEGMSLFVFNRITVAM